MLRTILVPLDGSSLSERAVPYAQTLARAGGARLIFLRAVLTAGEFGSGALLYNSALRSQAQGYLAPLVDMANSMGLIAEAVVRGEEAGKAIAEVAKTYEADLMVMSTHGRGGLSRVVWGSVADRVLRLAPVPVLLIPHNAQMGWARPDPFRIILPLDGSVLAERAVEPARELATALGAGTVLVAAVDPIAWLAGEDMWGPYRADADYAAMEQARTYLDSIARIFADVGLDVRVQVAEGAAASVIRAAAREHQAGAIVMATHGRGGVTRLLMGSVTDTVLRTARVPVLVVRPAAVRVEWVDARSPRPAEMRTA